jgi:PKD repeat protein
VFSQTFVYSWPIPHSGQTKCYDNEKEIPCPKPDEPFYGQSGNYSNNSKSYTKLDERGNNEIVVYDDNNEVQCQNVIVALDVLTMRPNKSKRFHYDGYDGSVGLEDGIINLAFLVDILNSNDTKKSSQKLSSKTNSNKVSIRIGEVIDDLAGIVQVPIVLDADVSNNILVACVAFTVKYSSQIEIESVESEFFELFNWKQEVGQSAINGCRHVERTQTNILFTSNFKLKENATPSTYPLIIQPTVLNNPDAGYDVDTPIDMVVGYDLSESLNSSNRYPVLLGSDTQPIEGSVTFPKKQPPVIELIDDHPYCIETGQSYIESGAVATDENNKDVSLFIQTYHEIDINTPGKYHVYYYLANPNIFGYKSGYTYSNRVEPLVSDSQPEEINNLVKEDKLIAFIIRDVIVKPVTFAFWTQSGSDNHINKLTIEQGKHQTICFKAEVPSSKLLKDFGFTFEYDFEKATVVSISSMLTPSVFEMQDFDTVTPGRIVMAGNSTSGINGPLTIAIMNVSLTGIKSGSFDITTTVSDFGNSSEQFEPKPEILHINVIEPQCHTKADFSYFQAPNSFIVNFDASTSTGHSYTWHFGDGTIGNGKSISHTYAYAQNFSVTLTVAGDSGNCIDSIQKSVQLIQTATLPPQNLKIEQNTANGIQLKWIPIDDTKVSYTIYRSQNEQGLFYPIHSEPVDYYDAILNGFWDTGIETDQTYFYKIKSYLAGKESLHFSNTAHMKTPDDHPTFDVQFLSNKHQIVPAGSKVIYSMVLNKTDAFQGALDIWCENLPAYVRYELSVNHQPSGTRANNIHLLPASLTLSIITGSATSIGDHQFDLQCLNNDSVTGYKQKTWKLDLTVVPLTGGIFVDVESYHIYKNDPVAVSGRIYLFKENQSIQLEAWNNDQKYAATMVSTQAGGWFEDHEWLQGFAPGIYTIKAIWENTLPFSDETLIIEKTRPQLFLSSQENQVAEIDKDFTIKIEIQPTYAYETIKLRLFKPEDSQPDTFDLSTDENGQVQLSRIFFQEKGKHTFKAYFMGNDSSIGCESSDYPVMVGNTGFAILVGGGIASNQNLEWNVTKKLLTDAYLDFKRMGFSDDMIYLMIDSEIMDINGDDIKDDIVDEDDPSVNKLIDVIKTEFSDVLTENDTLYLYMMGHGTNNAKFRLYGADEYISSAQLNTALKYLQENTSCSVVIILEYCYSGTFIQALHHPKRLIITSADNEPYRTDDSGNISLSRYLFSRLCRGYSIQKAFEYARNKLTNIGYPSPRLDDFDDDHLLADLTYLPEQLKWTQPEISHIDLYPILDGKNTLSVSVSVESAAESITKVWAQVIPPVVNISSGTGTIQFHETQLNHVQGTEYSGEVEGFSYDGNYNVIFYAKNRSSEVSEPVQWIVRAMNIGRKKDFNQDGFINLEDMIIVLRSLSGMNVSEKIDLTDAVHLMQYFGKNSL